MAEPERYDVDAERAEPIAERTRAFARGVLEVLQALAIAVLLSVGLNLFVIQVTEVRQRSMEPTLLSSDRVLVSKVDYRLHGPEKGDIIVFRPPIDAMIPYVKRVIALAGETVDLRDGKVYVNGKVVDEPYAVGTTQLRAATIPCTPNQLPATCRFPFVVPAGTIFVLGDNRPVSGDSREWGAVPDENIIGKVTIRFWPLADTRFFAW